MKKFLPALALFCASVCHAQGIVPVVRVNPMRLLIDGEIGDERTLGYKFPHIAIAGTIEQPITERLELQARLVFSPDNKTNLRAKSAIIQTGALFWIGKHWGLHGRFDYSELWTPQFTKIARIPAAGIVVRYIGFGAPGRLYLDWLLPTGCTHCALQSNRLQGMEGYFEYRLTPHLRMGTRLGFFGFLEQGNPFSDQPRIRDVAITSTIVLRYEIRAARMDEPY